MSKIKFETSNPIFYCAVDFSNATVEVYASGTIDIDEEIETDKEEYIKRRVNTLLIPEITKYSGNIPVKQLAGKRGEIAESITRQLSSEGINVRIYFEIIDASKESEERVAHLKKDMEAANGQPQMQFFGVGMSPGASNMIHNMFTHLCLIIAVLCMLAGNTLYSMAKSENEGNTEIENEEPDILEEAENLAIDLIDGKEGYSSILYDNTDGLPTSEANVIAATSEGFIWIGSYSGLIRYDGNNFERIDSTTGIASVVSLYVDSKDRLWVGTNDSGVAVLVDGEFKMYRKSDGLNSASIRSITEGNDGNIYIATTHGLAMIDENLVLNQVDEPQINDEYIRTMITGDDGVIYALTQNGAIFTMYDGKVTGFYDGKKLGIDDVYSIYPDKNNHGYVYIGDKQSNVYYGELNDGLKNEVVIDASPLEYINSVRQYEDELWICADNGIGIYENGKFTKLDNVAINSSAEGVMRDYQGNIWVVSSKQGVMKIVPNRFANIFELYNIPETVINSTCEYNDMLFIGKKNNGIMVLDDDGLVNKLPIKEAKTASGKEIGADDLISMLSEYRIRSIIRDSKNRLWISNFGENALVRYDNGNVLVFTEDDGLPSDRVRTIYERSDGAIMVAVSGGLVIIRDDKIEEIFDESSGISNTEILTITEADNKDMILGTDGDGIYVIRDRKVTHIGTESGLTSDVIMRIKKDISRDVYWIVTSNSIAYMDEDYNVSSIYNFPYSNNFDMYENSQGMMWILSSNGIYSVPVDELLKNEEIEPEFFGRENGLPCITTANSYSELNENGDLYIACTTGVVKVNIENDFEDVNDIKMAVPYVVADGVTIYPDENGTITIPSNVNKLTIYGYVFTYSLIDPQVTYYLDGIDKGKSTVKRSELAPVSYTNLRGGKYHFVMRLEDFTGDDSKEISILIIKTKAFYERLWFIITCILLFMFIVACIVITGIKLRTKKLLKKQEENKLLIREMVEAFAKTIDMKDKYTNGHSTRVAEYTAILAKELGYDEETVEKYRNIALLHDIGKIGVPPEVLNKPGKLTDREFAIIKSHSALGYNVLKDISIMPELAIGAGAHHERPDGKGYPKGLKGDEIPRVAQIIAVADTFDAMYSNRPYRNRMNFEKVVSIMKEVSGTQLESDVVEAFLRLVDKGEFRDPDDNGGGSLESIDNIHKKFESGEASTPKESSNDKEKEQEQDKEE